MTRALTVLSVGPGVTVQDLGRSGTLAYGLSRGGAADRLALHEGAALLGQDPSLAALEMAGTGGTFRAGADLRIALTGAPMRATMDGQPLAWNASHALPGGAELTIGPVTAGSYGYLHLGGGVHGPCTLGARAVHLAAGLGRPVEAGDEIPAGPDRGGEVGLTLDVEDRFDGGTLRLLPSVQTDLFPPEERARFEGAVFERDARGNRMGVRLVPDGDRFASPAGLSVLSEVIVPGDVQITGDGTPFVLLPECQTTGGYPRIGTVLPCDLPRIAQAPVGARLRFRFIDREEGRAAERRAAADRAGLRTSVRPLIRRPEDIPDLLSYQLIGGVTAGEEP